jgi:hypothetical protein
MAWAGGRPGTLDEADGAPIAVVGGCRLPIVIIIGRGSAVDGSTDTAVAAAAAPLPWNDAIGGRCGVGGCTSSFTAADADTAAAGADGEGNGGITACKGNQGDVVVEAANAAAGGGKSTTQPSARHRRYK